MAFKIVYQKRIHKLPLHVQTVAAIKVTVMKLYPNVDPKFHLIYIHNGTPLEIINEDALLILLNILQSPTIKLLIHEGTINDINHNDMSFMQQSSIFQSFVNTNQKPQTIKQLEQSLYSNQFDNSIRYPLFTQEEKQSQYPQIVQSEQYSYEILLNQPVTSYPDQEFLWKIVLKNNGNRTWPQTMKIKCLDGQYKGLHYPLPEAIPNQTVEITLKLTAYNVVGTYFINCCLLFLENTREQALSSQITLCLDVIMESPDKKYQGTMILAKAEQLKQVLSDKSINYLCMFIEKNRLLKADIQSIINRIYDEQAIEIKEYNYPIKH